MAVKNSLLIDKMFGEISFVISVGSTVERNLKKERCFAALNMTESPELSFRIPTIFCRREKSLQLIRSLSGVLQKYVVSGRLADRAVRFVVVLLFWIFISGNIFAQRNCSIEGKVIDAGTMEPVPFVNVFLSGTTFGSSTDDRGCFKITKLPNSMYDLVASMIGYKSQIIKVDLRAGDKKNIDFKIERTTYEFNQIDVSDKKPTEWAEHLELFKRLLFGNNILAKYCSIKNPYRIDFFNDGDKFIAVAHEPIKIFNSALGYKIECVLKNFEYEKSSQSLRYEIYPQFSEINPSTKDSLEKFVDYRKKTYFGSMAHLLSSLAVNNYKFRDEGFELRLDKTTLVKKADDIVRVDSTMKKYFFQFNGCLQILYWNNGKKGKSELCLVFGTTEFDPSGFLMKPSEFYVSGEMANEGVATMLPRFLEFPLDDQ